MRYAAIALAAAVLVTACGSRNENSVSASATISPTSTAAATPSTTTGLVAFPLDLPFIVGTNAGDLSFQIDKDGRPIGRSVHGCGTPITHISTYGRMALFNCSGPDSALYLYDDTSGSVTRIDNTENAMSAFDGNKGFAYVTRGASAGSAPISMTRLLYRDLATGATTVLDERLGVARDLRASGEGIAIWRPRNNDSFMRPDAEAGTWVIRGTSLTKLSPFRLIDGGNGRELLEPEGTDAYGYSTSSGANTHVVLRIAADQVRLTPADVSNEKAVALLEDGRVVAWRPTVSEYEGVVVVYDPVTRAVIRTDRGKFSPTGVLRTGNWLIGLAYLGGPPKILGYRISDGSFASIAGGSIGAFAFLGAR
ncbi:MAG: hypothetical protein ABI888_01115 [Chloroflexota bacterium]